MKSSEAKFVLFPDAKQKTGTGMMRVRDLVNEIVDAAIERNKDRVQYFSMIYRIDKRNNEGERLNRWGEDAKEVGFVEDDFYAGELLLNMRADRHSAQDGYVCCPDRVGFRSVRHVVYRFHWTFLRKEEMIEGLRNAFRDQLFNFDSELDADKEKELREDLESAFEREENFAGDDVKSAFNPYYFEDDWDYAFTAYDPEALMDELIAARQFCARERKKFRIQIDDGIVEILEEYYLDVEYDNVVVCTSEISDETLRKVCIRFQHASPDHPVHLTVFCFEDAD